MKSKGVLGCVGRISCLIPVFRVDHGSQKNGNSRRIPPTPACHLQLVMEEHICRGIDGLGPSRAEPWVSPGAGEGCRGPLPRGRPREQDGGFVCSPLRGDDSHSQESFSSDRAFTAVSFFVGSDRAVGWPVGCGRPLATIAPTDLEPL
ncbi:hypothetical protein GWK47_006506 [Chionoecetes opilio]|uniref:Uncharacterized protein n=1 Tax=Chionoecetes opilio TaxID=41210 RepID=A0A8J4Y5P3_CHIOP|nr:hypothetical protein GWK47_006506 [Chionoecetes opilio]